MKTIGAITSEIALQYAIHGGGWMRISDLQGLTAEEIKTGIEDLLEDDDFRAEPEPLAGHDETAPVIGGEARHKIRWI